MTLKAVSLQPVQLYAAPAFGGEGTKFRVTNLDEVSTIYLDSIVGVNAQSTPLPQQATVTYGGNRDVWASSLAAGTTVLADVDEDSLTWDNPVGVQIALNALGLATLAEQVNQNTAIPTNIQVMGAPPFIPNQLSSSEDRMTTGGSPYALVTMPSNGRLWYASLSYGVATTSSYSIGGNDPAARIYIGALSETILLCQAVIADAGQNAQADQALSFGGLPLNSGTTIYADVNGGTAIPNVSQNASAVILYSIP